MMIVMLNFCTNNQHQINIIEDNVSESQLLKKWSVGMMI